MILLATSAACRFHRRPRRTILRSNIARRGRFTCHNPVQAASILEEGGWAGIAYKGLTAKPSTKVPRNPQMLDFYAGAGRLIRSTRSCRVVGADHLVDQEN